MARTIKGASLWELLLTILFLSTTEKSLCGSTETQAHPQVPLVHSQEVLFHSLGSRSELSHSSKSKRGVEADLLGELGVTGAIFGKRQGRLLSSLVEKNPTLGNKDVEALMAFKAEITSDPLGVLHTWRANDSDPCSWVGVGCSENTRQVTTLNLVARQLVGKISPSLGHLQSLEQLELSENFLSGPIPANLANCSNLLHINISFNNMIGDIPSLLGLLQHLQTLDLSNNTLSGKIPGNLGNCTSLQYLDLGYNSFQGGIPSQFGALHSLTSLILHETSISGSLPPALGNCSSLTLVYLGGNSQLGGELPLQLGNLVTLQYISLSTCSFSGNIPMWILNFTALQGLNLEQNQFTGEIPMGLGQLSNLITLELKTNLLRGEIPVALGQSRLETLKLGDNMLKGEIPRSILNITSLRFLSLFENQLSGTIPQDIGLLQNLEFLQLFGNTLSGLIPSSLCNCSAMQSIQVGENPFDPQMFPSCIQSFENLWSIYLPDMNLKGEIPNDIGKLSYLQEFIVFSNNLSGEIPNSFQNCTALTNFDVRANQLVGKIPPNLGLLPLKDFVVASNPFTPGPVPSFIYNLSTLKVLEFGFGNFNGKLDGDFGRLQALSIFQSAGNYFEGPVPESLGNCSMIRSLELQQNSFIGEIPTTFSNLSLLNYLSLQGNNLHGNIPTDFMRNFQVLEYLDLSDNGLGGNLPINLGDSTNLQHFIMFGNNFEGNLPSSLANCTHLILVDVSQNSLTGILPGSVFGSLSSLAVANLSHNSFSGPWPSQLGLLTELQVVDVSSNFISGTLPLKVGELTSLEVLDLSLNNFTGAIPQELGLLKKLTSLNVSYNNFAGPIPEFSTMKTNISATSFLGNPGLCGAILGPQRVCLAPVKRSHCKGFKCPRAWAPMVSIFITLMILMALMFFGIIHCHLFKVHVHDELLFYSINPSMVITESKIRAIVNDPEQENMIGLGTTSVVYKTTTRGGKIVAIKVLKGFEDHARDERDSNNKKRWEVEFGHEARTLSQMRHRNVLRVFGLCFTLDIKAIILEYMPKGSLHTHLHGEATCELTWAQRFQILLGVTHGMVYLHHGFSEPIIHRDLKPGNILLDDNMEAKVCDFGISRFATNENGEATASTCCGTFGYMAPEYGMESRVSTKGDVYSYGVVLFELLTGRTIQQDMSRNSSHIMESVFCILEKSFQESDGQVFDLLDPAIKNEGESNAITKEQMMLTMKVGLLCTRMMPQKRPPMNIVLEMLLEIEQVGQRPLPVRTIDEILQEEDVGVTTSSPQNNDISY